MNLIITVSFDPFSKTFSKCVNVLSSYYSKYENVKFFPYYSSSTLLKGEVKKIGDHFAVGAPQQPNDYDNTYEWTELDYINNNSRDRFLFSWLSEQRFLSPFYFTCSATSIVNPDILFEIIKRYDSDDLHMGKVVFLEGGPLVLSGAGVLYSRKIFLRMLARKAVTLDSIPDDIANAFILKDTAKVPATRLDVYDSKAFLGEEPVEQEVLYNLIKTGYYHVRVKYKNSAERHNFDPLLLFRISTYFSRLRSNKAYIENCINLLHSEKYVVSQHLP